TLRHSCSHIMAQAVKQLWPDVKLGIGPSIEDGFYYDFDTSAVLSAGKKEAFTEADLAQIEEKMKEIIAQGAPFVKEDMSKEKARRLFAKLKEDYKIELIDALTDEQVSTYKTGDGFVDLCRGPHVDSTNQIKAFKLLSVAGAYWHGIETNPMLQRIYGTCFITQEELDEYINNLEEAKKRDHRKLGPQLEIFNLYPEEAGAGLVFYHPKGAVLRTIIEDYLKKAHLTRGYKQVITPHIMEAGLWRTSGHYEYYLSNMYTFRIPNDKQDEKSDGSSANSPGSEFVLKPMNCPGHILIYKSKVRSYRELPLRFFELGTVYRYEKAGVLHGLMRARGFTQDDAHIFSTPEQLKPEIMGIIDFVLATMSDFGFVDLAIELSTRPEKSIGTDSDWQEATAALEDALKAKDLDYETNPQEGAFYGPKIDIKIKDALKRKWQCATIQCDFALPQRFDLEFIDSQGSALQPIMLHRVILGSIERFIGVLIEHYAGSLPLWLSPTQVTIIPINATLQDYTARVTASLENHSIRVTSDDRNLTLEKRIRQALMEKIPYLLIIGGREAQSQTVAVRQRGRGDIGAMSLDEFIGRLKQEESSKAK
ncbi:MAG: threonine--tRNA ligase, partial [Candidatus Omnitrophota bacterium]